MDYKKSFEEIEKVLLELQEKNRSVPIVVEGDKDVAALRKLDIKGIILCTNTGKSLSYFCDVIAEQYKEIIILTDWDWRGGRLCYTIRKNLEDRVTCDIRYRELFARHAMIRTVEGLPSWIETMKKKLNKI
ncbi:MAG: topoisomerase [Candidatus Thermoplasmatota archaeon]|jgi:2,5-diamino-6-(ribosylamino)-4(3H)-pyrimidinone 5'-phosphate reductase|nr:topoisomerase [Candidatus Thermoplasmatota archaeon]